MLKDKEILRVALITTITVFVWIAVEAYIAYKEVPFTRVPPQILSPINPQVDISILEK